MGFGDDLLLTAEARAVKRALGIRSMPTYWSEVFDHNPNLLRPGCLHDPKEPIWPIKDNRIGHRPYHLGAVKVEYNGHSGTKVIFNPHFKACPGEVYGINLREDVWAQIILEPNYKPDIFGANKDWGWSKYEAVANHFAPDCAQLGPEGTPTLPDVPLIETPTFRDAMDVLSTASLYIGPEGGLHHAAAALGIPAVVIFGGHTPPSVTGYDGHINLASDDAGCGHMFPCDHCRRAMDGISVESVIEAAEKLLGE